MSLKRNEGEGIIREDTGVQNRVNEGIIGELNTSKETEIEVEACNEELSLAKEFGAAKLLGSGRNANKNLTPRNNSSLITRDNLSGTSSLKSHDTNGNGFTNKSLHMHHVPGLVEKELNQRITRQQEFRRKGKKEWLHSRYTIWQVQQNDSK